MPTNRESTIFLLLISRNMRRFPKNTVLYCQKYQYDIYGVFDFANVQVKILQAATAFSVTPPTNWITNSGQLTIEYHIEHDGFSIYVNDVFMKYVSFFFHQIVF